MLNLKCVLDNSKMINLLSGSPQKQANQAQTSSQQKYAKDTLEIQEVSEEHDESEQLSSSNRVSPADKSASNEVEFDEKKSIKLLTNLDSKLLRYSSSTGEFRKNRAENSTGNNLVGAETPSLRISLLKSHEIIQGLQSSLEQLHGKVDSLGSRSQQDEKSSRIEYKSAQNCQAKSVEENQINCEPGKSLPVLARDRQYGIQTEKASKNSLSVSELLELTLNEYTNIKKLLADTEHRIIQEFKQNLGGAKLFTQHETVMLESQSENCLNSTQRDLASTSNSGQQLTGGNLVSDQIRELVNGYEMLRLTIDQNLQQLLQGTSQIMGPNVYRPETSFKHNSNKNSQSINQDNSQEQEDETEENLKENSVVLISHPEHVRKFSEHSASFDQDRESSVTESGHSLKQEFISVSSSKQCLDQDRLSRQDDLLLSELGLQIHGLSEKVDSTVSLCQDLGEKISEIKSDLNKTLNIQNQTEEKLVELLNQKSEVSLILRKLDFIAPPISPVAQQSETQNGLTGLNLIDIQHLTSALESTIQTNLNSKSVAQTFEFLAREIGSAKFFNLTQMIFRISSQMTNSIADLAKFHPNFKHLRKEIIRYDYLS